MNRRSLWFWLWPIAAAFGIATAIGLDIALIAMGEVPAVPALLFTFAVPGIAGLVLGVGNRRARGSDLMLMALTTAAVLYGLMVVTSIVGIVMSSNVSCAEANAPPNCDNDIGAGVGLVIGMPVAASYWIATWLGELLGAALAGGLSVPRGSNRSAQSEGSGRI
jgi:hypothetical protein